MIRNIDNSNLFNFVIKALKFLFTDWTENLNKQMEKLANTVLKLKSYHKAVDFLKELVKDIIRKDCLSVDLTLNMINNQKVPESE